MAVLLDAKGAWVCGEYFLREMFLSQYHRAIHQLEKRDGIVIEHSDFTSDHGFKSYRIASNQMSEPRTTGDFRLIAENPSEQSKVHDYAPKL